MPSAPADEFCRKNCGPRVRYPLGRLTCDYLVTYCVGVDEVFKALADPTRRQLLDELNRSDGQTLTAL